MARRPARKRHGRRPEMGEAVDVIDAIEWRTSCHAYTDRTIEQEKIDYYAF